eukprot:g79492.t1
MNLTGKSRGKGVAKIFPCFAGWPQNQVGTPCVTDFSTPCVTYFSTRHNVVVDGLRGFVLTSPSNTEFVRYVFSLIFRAQPMLWPVRALGFVRAFLDSTTRLCLAFRSTESGRLPGIWPEWSST